MACTTRTPRSSTPVAFFASSTESGAEWALIRERWLGAARAADASGYADDLRGALRSFIVRYPNDGLIPVARAYLALVLLGDDGAADDDGADAGDASSLRGVDESGAEAQLALLQAVPRGSTGDLVAVVRARSLRLHGDSAGALAWLEPRVGKSVDPIVRALFQEELVAATMDAGKEFEAIAYMSTWLNESSEEERDLTRARIEANMRRIGRDDLLRALESMRASPVHAGYSDDILKLLVDRLADIALEKRDNDLARELMDPDAGPELVGGDAGIALAELAETRTGLNVVDGRTIGLLLPTELPALRDEAASVLRGVMWALGLPRGIRQTLVAPQKAAIGDAGVGGGKGSLDASTPRVSRPGVLTCPAPDYSADPALIAASEPNAGEGNEDDVTDGGLPSTDRISLVIRDDSGDPAQNRESLLELAGLGASVIIAALDPATSARVLGWSHEHDIPVIVLAAPRVDPRDGLDVGSRGGGAPANDYGFILGTPRAQVLATLKHAVPALGEGKVGLVIDESDRPFVPAHGGSFSPFARVEEPVSCDVTSARAGSPRFPIAAWRADGYASWLVTGSPACAEDVVTEIATRNGPPGVVALGLDSATLLPHAPRLPPGLRVVTASAGIVPAGSATAPDTSEVHRFAAAFGESPDWWTALGRDAATLARLAIMPQHLGETTDAPDVAALRAGVARGLATSRALLWTTDARGFGDARVMPRTVCVMDVGAR